MNDIEERLQEIQDRVQKASPGPWKVQEKIYEDGKEYLAERRIVTDYKHPQLKDVVGIITLGICIYEPHYRVFIDKENAEFIAHAREDIPFLLNLVREQQKEIDRLQRLVHKH
jgi:hypothetical protein